MTHKEHSNIILIDGEYLEFITTDFKKSFEGIIGRNLNDIDLADLIVEFAHMGGISGSNNNIEVIFIYNDKKPNLSICHPSSIPNELTDVAFADTLGEFSFRSYPTEQMVTCEEMFVDSLQVICDSDAVKRLIVVGNNEKYGAQIKEILNKAENKIITNLSMTEPDKDSKYLSGIVAFPIMGTLGIKPEELPQK